MIFRSDAVRVSLAYRYHNPQWEMAKNQSIYGADHNVEGIGANMTVWLEVEGAGGSLVIPENSMSPHLAHVKELLDHRCLFEVEPWFRTRVPTLENIAVFISERIWREPPPAGRWASLEIQENDSWKVKLFPGRPKFQLSHSFATANRRVEVAMERELNAETGLIIQRLEFVQSLSAVPEGDTWDEFYRGVKSNIPDLVWLKVWEPQKRAWEFHSNVAF